MSETIIRRILEQRIDGLKQKLVDLAEALPDGVVSDEAQQTLHHYTFNRDLYRHRYNQDYEGKTKIS